MTVEHVHIAEDGGEHAVVYLGPDGCALGDGSRLAEFAIHEVNHRGLRPEHGEKLLESIVDRLGTSTLVSACHRYKPDCLAHISS